MPTTGASGNGTVPRLVAAACWYYLSLFPLIGTALSVAVIPRKPHPNSNPPGFVQSLANWDGVWFERIVNDGYYYDSAHTSSIAFFPGYPLLGWSIHSITGLNAVASLLIISQVSYFLLLFAIPLYLRDQNDSSSWSDHTLLAVIFWPMSLFFRTAYSESLFVLLTVLVLMGNRRQWPLIVVAVLAGAASGVRAVGIVPAALVVYRCLRDPGSPATRLVRAVFYGGIGLWGLLGFMAFQYFAYGDPLAFCRTQAHWGVQPALPLWRSLLGLLTLEPVWSVYVPSYAAHWAAYEWSPNVLVGLQFWNPVFFVLAIGLVLIGAYRRWLTRDELLLSIGLLLIPYVLQSHRLAMMGQARFSGAIFPCYVVMGRLLMEMPPSVRAALCGLCACAATLLMALFAAWYRVF